MIETISIVAAAVAYLVASVCYGAHVLLRTPRLARMARFGTLAGVLMHTLAIGVHCAVTHRTPLTTPSDTLSASAWAIAIVYLILDFAVRPQPVALGAVAMPIALFCLFAGSAMHHSGVAAPANADLNNSLISLHVMAILFAFGLLVLAFGCAVLYLMQHRMIKKKQAGRLFGKLPPLTSIDRLGFGLVAFAFPMLTIGLVCGAIKVSGGGFPIGWLTDPKVLLSAALWSVEGIYLALHVLAHWRGPRANYILIGGMLIAVAAYFAPTAVHKF